MPVFDGKHLTTSDDGETLLALILHPTQKAREEARERGRLRAERATKLAELSPALPGTTLAAVTPLDILPAN
ncbi:hypothetical protein [Methylorubrum populi]|uniref:Uncharacterized protein n=1 Tax=Methylorubrum populi TaxID=223967 RepID=A0A921JE00_9HYPH|nr:hypothetical protein [Methylorubrum populi]